MYFSGTLSIDPSQLTHIEIIKPTKVFGKLLHTLTAGLASEKEEQETFTAVAILQQLNMAFREMGITDIVRLAKDDLDYYLDEEGREDDLKETMERFRLETDHYESELFDTLFLVVEHEDEALKYLIEVEIKRRHKVGEYPIDIKLNGIIADFNGGGGKGAEEVKKKMAPVFKSQESYDRFRIEKQSAYDRFLSELEQNVRKYIKVDHVIRSSNLKMIRPKKPVQQPNEIPTERHSEPVYYGYPGFGEIFFYAWLWSTMTHDHHIHVNNVDVVDEHGSTMMSVGEQGFDAGETDALNAEAPFEPPNSEDVSYHSDHEFQEEFDQTNLTGGEGLASVEGDDSGWLDSFGDFSFDSDSFSSSCSSCGGGCGGD